LGRIVQIVTLAARSTDTSFYEPNWVKMSRKSASLFGQSHVNFFECV
jgi:hypothetical protein